MRIGAERYDMRLDSDFSLMVLAKHTKDGKDGKKYFSICVDNGQESEDVSCTQELYDIAVVGKINRLIGQYNSQYKFFRFTGLKDSPKI